MIGSAYPTSWILSDFVDRVDQLSGEQTEQLGRASRRLLEFAWARTRRDPRLVAQAIRFVGRTFGTDVRASAKLLRRAIEPDHLARHGSEELNVLAGAVAPLTPHDPGLVRDIYRGAFGYKETSEAPTPFGGRVLPLVSNRRQDYQMALYQLVRSYPDFLRAAPQEAVVAMDAALESYVTQEHSSRAENAAGFDLDGKRAFVLADYSHIWDRGQGRRNDYPVELLDHLERRLEELAGGNGDAAKLANLLDTVVRTCRLACVWRRLLGLGTRYPNQIGMRIRAAGWSLPILMCRETIRDVGTMDGALFLDLSEADREKVERAILSIPGETPPERQRLGGADT